VQQTRRLRLLPLAATAAVLFAVSGCAGFIRPVPEHSSTVAAEAPAAAAARALAADDLAGAEAILQKALAEHPETPKVADPKMTELWTTAARLRIRQQLYPEAERDVLKALGTAQAVGPVAELTSQRAVHYRVAEAYEDAGRDDDAVTHLRTARDLCLADPTLSESDACESERNALVRVFMATGRYPDAEPLVLGRIADVQAHNGSYDLRLADTLSDAASFYSRQGQYELSAPLYARSFDIWKNFHDDAIAEQRKAVETGQQSPYGPEFLRIRARHAPFIAPVGLDDQPPVLYKLGKPEEAASVISFERRLWEADETAGPQAMNDLNAAVAGGRDGADLVLDQEAVAYVYFKRSDYPHAEEYYRQALGGLQSLWPSLTVSQRRRLLREYLDILGSLVVIDRSLEHYGEAVDYGRKQVELAEALLDARDALRLDTLSALATSYREARDIPKAHEYSVRYMNAVAAARGNDHPDYAWALRNLGYVYLLEGAVDRSQSLENEARSIWARHPIAAPEF